MDSLIFSRTKKIVFFSLLYGGLSLSFVGCGPALTPQHDQVDLSSVGTIETASGEGAQASSSTAPNQEASSSTQKYNSLLEQLLHWKEDVKNSLEGVSGTVSEPVDLENGVKQVEFELQISYGRAFELLGAAIEKAMPKICEKLNLPMSDPKSYNPGEMPCGKIIDGNWKHIYTYNMPKYKDTQGGFKIKLDPFKIPIYLGRRPQQGSYQEITLDQMQTVQKMSSLSFLKDLTIRYVPFDNKSYFQFCFNIPGSDISTPEIKVKGEAKKKAGFISAKAKAKIEGRFGEAQFSYMRSCVATLISLDPETMQPNLQISEIQKPQFAGVKFGKTKIKFKSSFAKFANKILKVFSLNLEKIIAQAVDRKVEKIEKDDVESGKWLLNVMKGDMNSKISQALNEVLASRLYAKGDLLTISSLRKTLKHQCEKIRSLIPQNSSFSLFFDQCDDFFNRVGFQFAPFYKSDEMAQKKCYDYPASIYEISDSQGKPKWWAKDCKFSMKVYAQFPSDIEKYKNSLLALLVSLRDVDEWPEVFQKILTKLQIKEKELETYLDLWKQKDLGVLHLEDLVVLIEKEKGISIDLEDLKFLIASLEP